MLSRVKDDLFWKGYALNVPETLDNFPALFSFIRNQKVTTRVEDMSPKTMPLDPNSWASGALDLRDKAAFKLFVPRDVGQCSLVVELRVSAGDADLFLGNGELAAPDRKNFHWAATGWGNNKITVHFFDPKFNLGFYYLTLEGSMQDRNTGGPCLYRLRWSWSEVKSPMAEVANLSPDRQS